MTKAISEELYEILRKPKEIKYRLCYINSQINNLQSCLLPFGIRYDNVKVSLSPSDKMSEIEAEIDKLEREHYDVERQISISEEQIKNLCRCLTPIEETVIMMRFVACQTFEQIGLALNYDRSGVWRVYDRAIKKMEDKIK